MYLRSYLPLLLIPFFITLGACAPTPEEREGVRHEVEIHDSYFVASDGVQLPLQAWKPDADEPEAVILALHGFNDYSNAFAEVADYWAAEHQIATYAYDQRGFGGGPQPGIWAGVDTYIEDARSFSRALRQRYPDVPLYMIGESMGGAITMVASKNSGLPDVDGIILSAPAVWARTTMPWYQRAALFIGSRTIPKKSFTGKGLGVVASDNRDMLIALGRDPKILKETKVDAIYGLTNLMDAALQSADALTMPSLILIGEQDQIVPNHASATMLKRLPDVRHEHSRTVIYEQGYHMLLRDLQRQVVWEDVASWIKSPAAALPSGLDSFNPFQWASHNR